MQKQKEKFERAVVTNLYLIHPADLNKKLTSINHITRVKQISTFTPHAMFTILY